MRRTMLPTAAHGQVVYLTGHGERLAAIVPAELENLPPQEFRDLLEDFADEQRAREALAEKYCCRISASKSGPSNSSGPVTVTPLQAIDDVLYVDPEPGSDRPYSPGGKAIDGGFAAANATCANAVAGDSVGDNPAYAQSRGKGGQRGVQRDQSRERKDHASILEHVLPGAPHRRDRRYIHGYPPL